MQHLKGTPLSPGIAIGPLFRQRVIESCIVERSLPQESIEQEVALFQAALFQAKEEIQARQAFLISTQQHVEASVMDAYLQFLRDPLLTDEIIFKIQMEKKNVEFLFHAAIHNFRRLLKQRGNAYFKERLVDLKDIEYRVLSCIKGEKCQVLTAPLPHSILFAQELSLSDIALGSEIQVQGFVTQYGGATSHAAIILQAKGIPFISSIDFTTFDGAENALVIMDGKTGDVFIDPEEDVKAAYMQNRNRAAKPSNTVLGEFLPSMTCDGHFVRLSANTELMHDWAEFQHSGACGVGLFRSEYLFISKDSLPSEEEQYVAYRQVVERLNGSPIAMRTFDFGGDKCFSLQKKNMGEPHSFMGVRAIRWLLKEKDFFKTQLRAILRAADYGDISVLFPMISSLSELLEAKALLREAQNEVGRQKHIQIGCMIEVPSAAIIADHLAKECDFLSIGTNDLVQYTLAIDRGISHLTGLYTPCHPSILRLIKFVIDAAKSENIPLSLCGEAAADVQFLPLLLGLGIDELSVALHHLPKVKAAIRQIALFEARQLAEEALQLPTSEAIEMLLKRELAINASVG